MKDRIGRLFDLEGQVAVIANNSLGSCREIATLLASAGATVVIGDSDVAEASRIAGDIEAEGGRACALECRIEEEPAVQSLFEETDRRFGRVDILIHAGGLTSRHMLTETTAERWDHLNAINLRSPFLCMREAAKLMVRGGRGGRIVNVTTVGAVVPVLHGNTVYSATRGGVTQLTRTVAFDYADQGIRANVLMPGAIPDKVPVLPDSLPSVGPILGPNRLPFGWGTAEDVAAATLFLASPASAYITGQVLVLDGGFLLS